MRLRLISRGAMSSRPLFLGAILPALLTLLAVTTSGCETTAGEQTGKRVFRIPISSIDYGTRPVDVGKADELNRLANLYAALQRRFQAGDMAGVCAHVSPIMFSQFPPGPNPNDGPCARRLGAFQRQLRNDGNPRPRLKIAWLRIYTDLRLAGITATDEKGKRLRVPFLLENGRWNLQLGSFARPDTLNGTLIPPP
jgi:hypothetical protein